MGQCTHDKTRAIYEQRAKSEGRKLVRVGSKCEACGALLKLDDEVSR